MVPSAPFSGGFINASGEERRKNAIDEGLTLSVRFVSALVPVEQEDHSAVSLSEEVLADVLAGFVFEFDAHEVTG